MSSRRTLAWLRALLCAWALLGCTSTYYEEGDGPVESRRGKQVDNVDEKAPGSVDLDSDDSADDSEEQMLEDAIDDADR